MRTRPVIVPRELVAIEVDRYMTAEAVIVQAGQRAANVSASVVIKQMHAFPRDAARNADVSAASVVVDGGGRTSAYDSCGD